MLHLLTRPADHFQERVVRVGEAAPSLPLHDAERAGVGNFGEAQFPVLALLVQALLQLPDLLQGNLVGKRESNVPAHFVEKVSIFSAVHA